jgi:glycosyltransferase involved in cell wall biosynthesis
MRRTPGFSIVIPTFNRADWIVSTIDSVLAQDLDDFELLVVDDGSTDGTESAVHRILDGRIRYHKKPNGERGAARNFGSALARGAYINFVDSDDLLYRHHLATAQRFIQERGEPEVFHLGYDIKEPGGRLVRRIDRLPETINRDIILGNCLSCNGVFLRRDIASAHPFNEDVGLSSSEDYELWLRLASRYPLWCANTVTSAVIDHPARSVARAEKTALLRRVETLLQSLSKDPPFMREYGAVYSRLLSRLHAYVALHLALSGDNRIESLRWLGRAVVEDPRILASRQFLGVLKRNLVSVP